MYRKIADVALDLANEKFALHLQLDDVDLKPGGISVVVSVWS